MTEKAEQLMSVPRRQMAVYIKLQFPESAIPQGLTIYVFCKSDQEPYKTSLDEYVQLKKWDAVINQSHDKTSSAAGGQDTVKLKALLHEDGWQGGEDSLPHRS